MFVVRYRRKYYATQPAQSQCQRGTDPLPEAPGGGRGDQSIEKSPETGRLLRTGYKRSSEEKPRPREGAQEHHVALCLVAYLIVERERLDCGATWRQRQRQRLLQRPQTV